MSHTYLDVPYKAKEEAKALGARWDPATRKWYVPEGIELTPFAPWLTTASAAVLPITTRPSNLLNVAESTSQPIALPKNGITLSQLLAGVAQAVAQSFKSAVWTIVEVVETRTRNGHVYLELSERTPDGNVLATARASIWANTASKILPEFERATGASIAPGIKLLVRAKPVFKAQYGFSIEIDAIDPDYTLGDLEARKREIRTRLTQEDLIDRNKTLPAPWDFNTVLVLAPQGAAGLGDFQAEATRLERFGICRFVYAASRFQGEGAAQEIRQVLLAALVPWNDAVIQLDAVVIIRGGGAVNDLAWLNEYELAKAICTLKVPVWTGIGHERDNTILDEVAHTRFDTPSKVIAGIEQVIQKRVEETKANFHFLANGAQRGIHTARNQIDRGLVTIQAGALRELSVAKQTTTERMNELRHAATMTVHEAKQDARTLVAELRHAAHQQLAVAKRDVPAFLAEIRAEAINTVGLSRTLSGAKMDAIRDRAAVDLVRSKASVQQGVRDVSTAAHHIIQEARTTSTALLREVAGQGPDKTLGRGFVIVRDEQGKPVTSAAGAPAGTALDLEFRDGRVAAQVHSN